ncbi:MAG: NUDIX domain-containing protein, partial [Ectothiorhodospiraceae bacterium]
MRCTPSVPVTIAPWGPDWSAGMKVRTLSAGVVVVRREAQGWRCLLLRAYQYWDAPKGRVEAGETPLEAARREVREETGI